MKTLVAPTDFSPDSLNAVNYAADMACVIGANLVLLHVCLLPVAFTEVTPPSNSIDQIRQDAEQKLEQLREKVSIRTAGLLKIDTVIRQGSVVREIDDFCASVDTYAVVMGPESAGALQRFLSGGRTVSAIKQLSWPLIVVPREVKFNRIRKIGLACDLRKVVQTLPIKEIKAMVTDFQTELHVLHVSHGIDDVFSNEKIEESGWLQDIIRGLKPTYHFIAGVDVEKGIIDFAEKNKLDLLIVIPKKHSLFNQIFQHSLSRCLVLHSHVPVMAIHE